MIVIQRKFATDLLQEFDCSDSPIVLSPLDSSVKISIISGNLLVDHTAYRHLVEKLNYLTHTSSNLSFAVLTLSQYMQQPYEDHFITVLRVLRYLRANFGQDLFFTSNPSFSLIAFCDVDWASCKDT